MLLSDLIDPDVHQDHDHTGGEERANGGVKNIPALVVQLADLLASFTLIQGEERREGDDRRDQPHHDDAGLDARGSTLGAVGHGPRDGQVAVQSYCAQVHDGGGTEENVQRQVDLTPEGAESPVALQLVCQRKGNNECGHENIRRGQRHQEQVLRPLQGSRGQHGDDDQDVPDDCHDHHEGDGYRKGCGGLWRVGRGPGGAAVAGSGAGDEAVGESAELRQARGVRGGRHVEDGGESCLSRDDTQQNAESEMNHQQDSPGGGQTEAGWSLVKGTPCDGSTTREIYSTQTHTGHDTTFHSVGLELTQIQENFPLLTLSCSSTS